MNELKESDVKMTKEFGWFRRTEGKEPSKRNWMCGKREDGSTTKNIHESKDGLTTAKKRYQQVPEVVENYLQ